MKSRTSIGVEIEVNSFNRRLETSMAKDVWTTAPEHCGVEIRSTPCGNPRDIRRMVRSLSQMNIAAGTSPGFDNTGTHIHIDFLKDIDVDAKYLKRITSSRGAGGTFDNPLGNGKKYFWLGPDGAIWASPKSFLSYLGKDFTPATASRAQKDSRYLFAVKRFLTLGIRFGSALVGLQHPDRRFNKYCHPIVDWSEEKLEACKSIKEICSHPNLAQDHRRHSFNVLSFPKYGTVEIRMIKGSLSPDELWPQIFLFGKMAKLAKSSNKLPVATGNIFIDFSNLLDASEIHGKIRRSLTEAFNKNMDVKSFNIRCFRCERFDHFGQFSDYGLSRGVCNNCASMYIICANCGNEDARIDKTKIDDALDNGRYLCRNCYHNINIELFLNKELDFDVIHIMGQAVGCGLDDKGPTWLRRSIALFS